MLDDAFRAGEVGLLAVSKVANFSADLPSVAVAVQVSRSFVPAGGGGAAARPAAAAEAGRPSARFYGIIAREPWTRTSPSICSGSWPSRGYAYRIMDADNIAAEKI